MKITRPMTRSLHFQLSISDTSRIKKILYASSPIIVIESLGNKVKANCTLIFYFFMLVLRIIRASPSM